MKRLFGLLALGAALTIGVAFAGVTTQPARWAFKGGLSIGPTADGTAGNRITESLGASAVIDFVSGTIVCTDSANITVTGATIGDTCSVGTPAAAAINSTFSCYVSAADTVKVRHCPAGTAIDPASATYFVRVFSSQ